MTRPRHTRPTTRRLLRWIFRRGNQFLTCQLERGRAYTLSLVTHGQATAAVETFSDGLSAFRRHAAVSAQLREYGWTVASYGRC